MLPQRYRAHREVEKVKSKKVRGEEIEKNLS
jgi:hypothetical protein